MNVGAIAPARAGKRGDIVNDLCCGRVPTTAKRNGIGAEIRVLATSIAT